MGGTRFDLSLVMALVLLPACASDRSSEALDEPVVSLPAGAAGPSAPGATPEVAGVAVEASSPVDRKTVYRTPQGAVYFHTATCARVQVGALPLPISSAERHFRPCPVCRPGS